MAGTIHTINFNNGNPFTVNTTTLYGAAYALPSTVSQVTLTILDPNGDWVNAANAGGNFLYGLQCSGNGMPAWDGGSTWDGGPTWDGSWFVLVSNGTGQPVGSLARGGALPSLSITRDTGLSEAYGMSCRGFVSCTHTISIAARATITD